MTKRTDVKKVIVSFVSNSLLFLGTTLGTLSALSLVARNYLHAADLLAQFAHISSALLIGTICWAAISRHKAFFLTHLALLTFHLPYLQHYLPTEQAVCSNQSDTHHALRLTSWNLLEVNSQKKKASSYLASLDTDLIILFEIDEDWEEPLSTLDYFYPHRLWYPRETYKDFSLVNSGIALYSKYPLTDSTLLTKGLALPILKASIQKPEHQAVNLILTHLLAPLKEEHWDSNRRTLAVVLGGLNPQEHHLLLGDFNSSPTGAQFNEILKNSDLKHLTPTPSIGPSLRAFGLPLLQIDHLFSSAKLYQAGARFGPFLGSDHRPLLACVLVPRSR